MERTINFLELKIQLADIGFSEPHIIDQLREAIYNDHAFDSLYTDRENVSIQINLEKDYLNNFQFETYDTFISTGGELRDQVFTSNVPVSEAIALLESHLQRADVSAAIASEPMSREWVRASLGLSPNPNIDENSNQLNIHIMNNQNLEFLKNSLLNLGFGEKVNQQLEKNISEGKPEFALLTSQTYNQSDVAYSLHFKAGSEHQMYFLNRFDAALNDKPDEKQSFYINKGHGITAKEAYNLMEGRAVHKQLYTKEGENYHAWVKLDSENLTEGGNKKFKQYNENYGYNPEQLLKGKGIKEMDGGQSEDNLLRSLKKGNVQQITVEKDGKEQKFYISANPQFKTVDLYDQQQKQIKREELLNPTESKSNDKKQSQQQKEELPAKKRSKSNKVGA